MSSTRSRRSSDAQARRRWRRRARLFSRGYGRAQGRELIVRQRLLDEHEEHVLLMTNVRPQPRAQLVQRGELSVFAEVLCAPPDVDVLDQHAHDRLVIGPDMAREGGQQPALLEGEVMPPLAVPEGQEGVARGARRIR